jgi:hypothetical protein
MSKTSNGLPLTIPLNIPAYWTPEQAFAVVELFDDLRDRIWAHYGVQLLHHTASSTAPPTVITPMIQLTIRPSESPCR